MHCLPPPVITAGASMTPTLLPEMQVTALDVKLMNNPSVSNVPFRLKVVSNDGGIQMRVLGGTGKPIEYKPNLRNGHTAEIGITYVQGIYFVAVLQGSQRKMVKLIKQ